MKLLAEALGEALADGDAHTSDMRFKDVMKPMRELWQIDVATGALQLRFQIIFPAGAL